MLENSQSSSDLPPNEVRSEGPDRGLEVAMSRLELIDGHLLDPSCPNNSSEIVRYGLAPHARMLERLHLTVSQRVIPTLPTESVESVILQRISTGCVSPAIASLINRSIIEYTYLRKTHIIALRCSKIYWFTDDRAPWTVVEWVENNETSNLIIFYFGEANELGQGSWLMHSGLKVVNEISKKQCWENSRIDWNVSQISHLKILFGAAQHIAGMLEWSVADATMLYCKGNTEEVSTPEMTRQAKLLYNHVLQIKLLNAAFDKVSPALRTLGLDDDQKGSTRERHGMSLYLNLCT